jgi:crossover junction endodeoxyribonuclease RusA
MITLPWPPSVLSPNARPHFMVKAKAFKAYKVQCHMLLSQYREALKGCTSYALEFRPRSARRIDVDNCLSAFKAGLDSIAIVSGVDDSKFRLTIAKGEPVTGGSVIVTPLALDASMEAA